MKIKVLTIDFYKEEASECLKLLCDVVEASEWELKWACYCHNLNCQKAGVSDVLEICDFHPKKTTTSFPVESLHAV